MESSPSFSTSFSSPPSTNPIPNPNLDSQPRLTVTQLEQLKVEEKVAEIYRLLNGVSAHARSLMSELWCDKHVEFLTRGLKQLGPSYHVLDANRPWLCYWILHSIALLGEPLDTELENDVVDFLSRCEDEDGGYGGGPGQLPHLATTYAAVNTLVTLGSENALSSINRDNIYKFLLRMKDSSGAFRMHDAGEIDVRACYTAISVASILNILDYELVKDVGNYILRCQTYEGGISGEPGSEAHGGYTFCGLATMILINEADRLDLSSLLDWVAFRQGVECGFQGRTNKLVDGCYSFWQGGVLALMQRLLPIVAKQLTPSSVSGESSLGSTCNIKSSDLAGQGSGKLSDVSFSFIKRHTESGPLFHTIALQQYILLCSQVLEGGFKDKPGKQRDFYHTCYCLSGLSVSQYSWSKDAGACPLPTAILGPYSNLLEPIHPLHNVVLDKYYISHEFFSRS
ncbi:protein farnesyltransferase subunit beta [Phoenix dactylifera]|uniref:Protein farnesyltransferase subunit beta n=1 Tax=Phoenix dactylifera TaxID=42345 RepID=A0A8B7CKW0_PHODC|nr:protein farnesyltransferase subunit beta [Phoenix dactylifera]